MASERSAVAAAPSFPHPRRYRRDYAVLETAKGRPESNTGAVSAEMLILSNHFALLRLGDFIGGFFLSEETVSAGAASYSAWPPAA